MVIKTIKSPLAPGGIAVHIRDISINKLVYGYKKIGINISTMLNGIEKLSIYQCQSSRYKFYYPLGITGNSEFYESLQNFEWYYMPWKWEHEVAISYLDNCGSLLEVGCAHGAFLKGANSRVKLQRSVGLELNETTQVSENNFEIVNQVIQEFQKSNQEAFDVVCSFQVLEHISEVYDFLEAKIKCLKRGGKLLISVPNNESFLRDSDSVLNMPPHHVGLWTSVSLRYLEKVFPIRLLELHYEPLQEYHVDSYIYATHYAHYPKLASVLLKKLDIITGRYNKIKQKVKVERESIAGHTVLAVYLKN